MRVFGTGVLGAAFHARPDCRWLKNTRHPVVELDLAKLRSAQPCKTCYPQLPNPRVAHIRCRKCNTGKVYPCAHNGGVLVVVPGQRYSRVKHVWPEQAHAYDLAPVAKRV